MHKRYLQNAQRNFLSQVIFNQPFKLFQIQVELRITNNYFDE